jgi:hypothetical protein
MMYGVDYSRLDVHVDRDGDLIVRASVPKLSTKHLRQVLEPYAAA